MSGVRKVALWNGPRVETGPLQFGDDWPGVFIRGDNAEEFAKAIGRALLDAPPYDDLGELRDLLMSCKVTGDNP